MKIITLVENRSEDNKLKAKHGISLYIETNGKKILFDTGPKDYFIRNAKRLNIDLSDVDYLFISHGHIDHGGGINQFLRINSKAVVYASSNVFHRYYTKVFGNFYFKIGLEEELRNHPRIHLIDNDIEISNNMRIFTDVDKKGFFPSNNSKLYKKRDGKYINDDFKHEIYLLIKENDNLVLFTGCSHAGITNIVEDITDRLNNNISHVIGGFHLYDPISKKYESDKAINLVARSLFNHKIQEYYTCHCTGEEGYKKLKEVLGGRIRELKTGSKIEF